MAFAFQFTRLRYSIPPCMPCGWINSGARHGSRADVPPLAEHTPSYSAPFVPRVCCAAWRAGAQGDYRRLLKERLVLADAEYQVLLYGSQTPMGLSAIDRVTSNGTLLSQETLLVRL